MTMRVVCIGSGYVGSVTAVAFAAIKHQTTVIDIDPQKIAQINQGESPIFEPGLTELIKMTRAEGMLEAETTFASVSKADVVFITVGTPSKQDGTVDLTYIKSAAQQVAEQLNPKSFTVIVNKSTVPVGTCDFVSEIIETTSGLTANEHFAVVSNPEFLREGYALEDVFYPDRIVIGTFHEQARKLMRQLYEPIIARKYDKELLSYFSFVDDGNRAPVTYFETDSKSAELIKYASNAFLAVKISYINEMAKFCETIGANALEVAKGMGLDTRIGSKFLQVSSGWSGSCFPKDTAELLATSQKYGSELQLVKSAVTANKEMHEYCIEKIQRQLKTLNGKRIGILGLTFKPNTDDARQTQASYIIGRLLELGADITVHDPKGMEMFKRLNGSLEVTYAVSAEEVATRADAIVLLTHWPQYTSLDWKRMYSAMRRPYVFDTRNFLASDELEKLGFTYDGLGV